VVLGLLGVMVIDRWRIIDLQVVDRDFLKGQGDARSFVIFRFRRTAA
jgi:cell division protein FtsI (penicillin-binding protein 3)